jgi:hypothetical protein
MFRSRGAMKSLVKSSVLLAVLIGFPVIAKAENWVAVGNVGGNVWYADTDSVSRKGDFATIDTKLNGLRMGTNTYDCARNNVLLGGPPMAADIANAMRDKACKHWWQVWK